MGWSRPRVPQNLLDGVSGQSCSLGPCVLGPHWESSFNRVHAGGAPRAPVESVCPGAETVRQYNEML